MRYNKTHRKKNWLNSISLFFLIATIALGFGIKYVTSSPKGENLLDKESGFIKFGRPNSPGESQRN